MRPTGKILTVEIVLFALVCSVGGYSYSAEIAIHETQQKETLQREKLPPFVPDQVVVAFRPGTPGDAKKAAHAQAGGRVINTIAALHADLVNIPRGKVLEKVAAYTRNPNVRYAEPNYYYVLDVPPTEGLMPPGTLCSEDLFDEQWALHNTGQSFQMDPYTGEPCIITGTDDADIDWLAVWEQLPGVRGENIRIAIVDTGIDFGHPDLINKEVESWTAYGIIEGAEDLIGHGTHVAGIAAAATDNGNGIAGVGIDASAGSLKACQCYPDPTFCLTGGCADSDIAEAISYATEQGYHVVNMSFGGPGAQLIKDAVDEALAAGLILVASAGNAYALNTPSYPAAYDGVIAVAATDQYDNLSSFSNFGQWVDIAAPGVDIFSTYPGAGCGGNPDCYSWMSGTSMASPVVAGAAALALDSIGGDSTATPQELRDAVINAILNNADHTGALGQNMLAWTQHGRLNIYAALSDNISPVAAFTYSCTGLECSFDAAVSHDPDGSIVDYTWDYGDGSSSSGMTGNHSYTNDGTYTVSLTVTDNDGALGSDIQEITISTAGNDTLHVGDLDGQSTFQSNTRWTAEVTVTVHDEAHNPFNGLTVVTGRWSGGVSGTDIGEDIDQNGQITFSYPAIHKRIESVTFTIESVSGSLPYDSNKNHDPDSDGDGMRITVFKPQ
jgi:thermitase